MFVGVCGSGVVVVCVCCCCLRDVVVVVCDCWFMYVMYACT